MEMINNEAVGPNFDFDKFKIARDRSVQLVHACAKKIQVGMTEEDGHEILKSELAKHGSEKLWHPSKVRFGINTLKTFREKSEPNVVLKKGDVFFFDIGPVFNGHEGDYGETFVCEEESNIAADASKIVFKKTSAFWRETKQTGKALYDFASAEANKLGFELNMDMDGHRLGDFPHALHFKGGLPDHEGTPVPGLWILEVHLRDLKNNRGTFFEDLLL